jgi:surface antigen
MTILLMALTACSSANINTPMATAYEGDRNEQCVPYARRVSGIQIYGDAHSWWRQAPKARRSERPVEGAVMVLSKTRRLRYGHLAVVTRVLNSREIEVTHTNWGSSRESRRMVYKAMRVKDVSKWNDWSRAIFWNAQTNAFGSPYQVSGFILP